MFGCRRCQFISAEYERFISSLQPTVPLLQNQFHCQEFLVSSIINSLCWVEPEMEKSALQQSLFSVGDPFPLELVLLWAGLLKSEVNNKLDLLMYGIRGHLCFVLVHLLCKPLTEIYLKIPWKSRMKMPLLLNCLADNLSWEWRKCMWLKRWNWNKNQGQIAC